MSWFIVPIMLALQGQPAWIVPDKRSVKPFGGGRPWLRGTRALCKFNCEKERDCGVARACCRARQKTRRAPKWARAKKYGEDCG